MTAVATPPGIHLPSLRPDPLQPRNLTTGAERDRAPQPISAAPPARRPVTAEILTELSLVLLALSASLAIARLIQGGLGHSMVLPLLACIAATSAVTITAARTNLNLAAVAAIGILVDALVTVWTVIPGATRFGLPTVTTVHILVNDIQAARAVMGSHRTPIPLVPGVALIVIVTSGAVCVAARTLWEFRRRGTPHWPRLAALVPTLGMFCYAAPLSARIDRPQLAIFYLSSALVFVAASDATGTRLLAVAPLHRARSFVATILPTIATAGAALLVLLLAAAALSGTTPLPFPWWSTPAPLGGFVGPGGKGGLTAISLVANLRGTEVSEAGVQMFVAQTPVPTYWKVGTLSVFNGSSWVPSAGEEAALNGTTPTSAPITPLLPPSTVTFNAKVTIDKYTGRLLPVPPIALTATSAAQSVSPAYISDGIGLAIASPITSGQVYSVNAGQTTVPSLSDPITFADIDGGLAAAEPEYLQLPRGVPPQVKDIAEAEVAGTSTPLQEVQALVNWFRGGSFVYTLSPAAVPSNLNPLLAFLTTYRDGYCQQFAGAFGVLARELGIPVRLAVGFTSGHLLGRTGDTYAIDGSDAHVWPEVYLGQSIGWLSVDPTPGYPSSGEATVPSVMDSRSFTSGGGGSFPVRPRPGQNKITPKTVPKDLAGTGTTAPPVTVKHSKPLPAGAILAAVVVVVALGGVVFYFRRTRRSVRPRLGGRLSGDPDSVVIRSWLRAADALGRAGFRRSQWTTPIAHAHEIRDAVTGGSTVAGRRADTTAALGTATFGYIELAELAEVACYSPGHCSTRDARHAEQEAWRIERALRSSGLLRRFPTQYRPAI